MRVGITLLTQPGHNVWSAGISQNVFHLAGLIRAIPFVEKVLILDCGNQGSAPEYAGPASEEFQIIPFAEATDAIDVAIELAGALPDEWTARFRARGGSLVYHNCGHPYVSLVEPTTFERPGYFGTPDRFDEVWLLQKDAPYEPMMRAIHRCPVVQVPYLWAPKFLEHSIETIAKNEGPFGYKKGSLQPGQVNPAIFEPNLSPRKCGIIPYLICETAHYTDNTLIGRVRFLNSIQMKDQRSFQFLIDHSHLFQQGKASIEPRDYFAKVMSQGANIVVSHQIEWSQNYLYLDTIYGNYPLVHNSELFREVGYYYPASDVELGHQQLLNAISNHDANLDEYANKSQAMIQLVSPLNPANIDRYARRLLSLPIKTKRV